MKLSSIFILVSVIISFLSTAHAEQISAGKFVFIRGDVTINRVVNNKPTQIKAQINDPVFKSDVVETTSNAAARIRLIDSNQIDIYPKTKLSISEYIYKPGENKKNVELSIDFGKVQSTVRQKYDGSKNTYRVKTPGIVAGVRGTIFTVGFESGRSSTSVTEGIVDVRINLPGQAASAAESTGALVKAQQKIEFSPSQKKIEVVNFSQVDQEKIKGEREIFKEADVKVEDKQDQSQKSSKDLNPSASEISNRKKEKSSSEKKPKKDQSSLEAVGSSVEQSDDVSPDDKENDNDNGKDKIKDKDKADQAKELRRSDRADEALENARGQQIKEAVSKGLKGQEKSSAESGAARRNEALQRKLKELNKISETTNQQSKERLKQQAEEEAARKKAEELAQEEKRLAEEAQKKAEEAVAKEKAQSGN